ncbi:DUF1194 domain-containing protein [Pelagibius sp.]|uniref:DUF1194 domain-containing protein n=1 Tax=Pelagibius sp. TaxID=1931238 RepID=UPI002615E94D|nr:DUF1194 domain-containing protein [Pelagibius sp.]
MLFRTLIVVLILGIAAPLQKAEAQGASAPLSTDFNLITAIDVSDSISRHEEWLQLTGLSRGVVHPSFVSLVREGLMQRIGFMAFTWSSDGQVRIVVPWTVIAGPEDAARVAAQLRDAPRIDRSHYDGNHQAPQAGGGAGTAASTGGMTDIAQAVGAATRIAAAAPYQGRRAVINILSDGVDNAGFDPAMLRDEAIRQGATVNGVVFGGRRDLPAYFRENVIGGPGAFLMTVQDPQDLPKALEKKFWRDLIAGHTPASAAAG